MFQVPCFEAIREGENSKEVWIKPKPLLLMKSFWNTSFYWPELTVVV